MNKEEKYDLVLALTEQMKEYGNFYITDTSDLTVDKINNIRRKCFESDIMMQVAKNSLIKKAHPKRTLTTKKYLNRHSIRLSASQHLLKNTK